MTSLHNEEIRAIQTTLVALKKGIALEVSAKRKEKMKSDIKELERILKIKLDETSDFNDIIIEEDIY